MAIIRLTKIRFKGKLRCTLGGSGQSCMIIYKVTCIETNKIYIGKTIQSLHRRKSTHLSDAKSKKYNSALHAAIRKYGEGAFIWEVLDRVMFSDLLFDLERYYIAKYNCRVPNGYNITDGGEGSTGYRHSEETRIKIRNNRPNFNGENNPMFGRHHSESAKYKMAKKKIGGKHTKDHNNKIRISVSKNPPFLGRHHTEETKEIFRLANTGRKMSAESKLKMSRAQSGRVFSEEHKRKISEARMGKSLSPETKLRISESRKKLFSGLREIAQ